MESPFDPTVQNQHVHHKLIAVLERLSEVFRVLLWEVGKENGLSPIQIKTLLYLKHHKGHPSTVTYLAKEYGVSKPTASDSIKTLLRKGLVEKKVSEVDARSFSLVLTPKGEKMAAEAENYADKLLVEVRKMPEKEVNAILGSLLGLVHRLNKEAIVHTQRMCSSCKHFSQNEGKYYCKLLEVPLAKSDLRVDCPEHQTFDN